LVTAYNIAKTITLKKIPQLFKKGVEAKFNAF